MVKKILVPLDGSSLAEAALPHAEGLAQQFGAQVVLLRVVVSPYAIVAPDLVLAGYDPNQHELEAHGEQYLKSVASQLEAKGLAVKTVLSDGPVAEAILEHAANEQADMIIMSTHGRGGVSRWVYGSVADRVLQASVCPILLIRVGGERSAAKS